MKKCVMILPYFGKFNNYFPLFLNSCAKNKEFDWLIYTDDRTNYDYPDNVIVKYLEFAEFRNIIESKFDFPIFLQKPYKLCDFRPAYGYIFENEVAGYKYWGHCDCDLIFGNLDKLLIPILEQNWDKVFAVGHLTLYLNTAENNNLFKEELDGIKLYKEFLSSSTPCWFDEDWKSRNIHAIFINSSKRIYSKDMSGNPSGDFAKFRLRSYDNQSRSFKTEKPIDGLFVWNNGSIERYEHDGLGNIKKTEYLYFHLQRRKMIISKIDELENCYGIIPNKFIKIDNPSVIVERWNSIPKYDISMLYQPYNVIMQKYRRAINKITKMWQGE